MYSFEWVSASTSTQGVAVEAQLSAPWRQVQSECKGRDVIQGRRLQRLRTWSRMSRLPLRWLNYRLSISCLFVLLDSDASVVQGRDDWVVLLLFCVFQLLVHFAVLPRIGQLHVQIFHRTLCCHNCHLRVCPSAQMQLYCFSSNCGLSSVDCPCASSLLQRKNVLAKILGNSLVKNNAFY